MKKIAFVSTLMLFISSSVSAQQLFDKFDNAGTLYRDKVVSGRHEEIEGSPYVDDKFTNVSISGVNGQVKSRYNAANDQVEIQDNEAKIYILPKENNYKTVSFYGGSYKLRLLEYTNSSDELVNGYLVELYSQNDVTLFRKDKIKLQAEKHSESSYGAAYSPPKYFKTKGEYYLQLKDGKTILMPKGKKQLQEILPAQKDAIATFFKANNYSFKEEADLIKIAEFVSTL